MPDNWQVQNNGLSSSSNASADNLEEAMWRLKIQTHGNQDGVASHSSPYPDRPGEPDCIYYLKTGVCGYGDNCRFNHPDYAGQAAHHKSELPERVGQPDCKYFLKTGTCKFGTTCKFHHPQDRHDTGQVSLNFLGLPMRQEEKSCPFYMRTGSCKFGIACKFHHPQPGALGAVLPVNGPAAFGSTGSSSSGLPYVGGLQAWSLPRTPYPSGPRLQGPQAYMPVVLSPSQGIIPAQQAWNTYMHYGKPGIGCSCRDRQGVGCNSNLKVCKCLQQQGYGCISPGQQGENLQILAAAQGVLQKLAAAWTAKKL
ncbi:hypothetical protein HHK36_002160 [Tetracentron sinense]|uniref:C3H1-type domain-containing protein n=1 Tax=Tetracentron sinense TaxID=13715 RepID=A0A834ZVA1_TETSI|nr:hypothetical protein HHK36_002160 [Tetracentron sinense]